MKHILGGLLALACVATPWSAAGAREAPGDLQSCVVAATGADDQRTLVQWMFSAIALHPDLEDMAQVSDARRDQANGAMGELMVRLLTVEERDFPFAGGHRFRDPESGLELRGDGAAMRADFLERFGASRREQTARLAAAGIRQVEHVLDEPLDLPLRRLFSRDMAGAAP